MSENKVVLISGSSRGLGKELAEYFKKLDMNVITMGFETNVNVDIRCNLQDLLETEKSLDQYFGEKKIIDLLICNAGTGRVPEQEMNPDQLDQYFREKNLITASNLIQGALPYLRSNASIIGISSIAALSNIEGAPPGYRKAKQSLNRLFTTKSKELAYKGIRFNLVSPGNIYFEGSRWEDIEKENPEFVQRLLKEKVPLGSFISPNEIGAVISFLSSENARNITGANIVIDGGQSIE